MAPPPADSVKASFRTVMLGLERSEMAPFFRAGLLFQGYFFPLRAVACRGGVEANGPERAWNAVAREWIERGMNRPLRCGS